MENVTIRKSTNRSLPIKLYAKVASRTRLGVKHTVMFIRAKGIERWTCSCEDQMFAKTPQNRHCYHIHLVRSQSARPGSKVGKRPILSVAGAVPFDTETAPVIA